MSLWWGLACAQVDCLMAEYQDANVWHSADISMYTLPPYMEANAHHIYNNNAEFIILANLQQQATEIPMAK